MGAVNYSLAGIREDCREGRMPMHHLWGLEALEEAGIDVAVLGSPQYLWLDLVTSITRHRFGDLNREMTLASASRQSRADVVVCAETSFAKGLGLLRRLRILRTPLVGVLHPYAPQQRWVRYCLGGFDHMICLTRQTERDARPWFPNDRLSRAGMGPDIGWPGYQSRDLGRVVSTGRTHRDLRLLADASEQARVPLTLHDPPHLPPSANRADKSKAPYGEVMRDLCEAAVVAIPLSRTDGCFGITELNDALALGKPILMTRNANIDVDIEQIGCGRWVDPGDLSGWTDGLRELMSDPHLRHSMGERGREYAQREWNHRSFGDHLVKVVFSVGERSVSSG